MTLACSTPLSFSLDSECWPQSFAFSPDGNWLAVGTNLGDIDVYSTTENKQPRSHLNVDNDAFNAVAVTFIEWKMFPWLTNWAIHEARTSDAGIVAAFEDGHIRLVESIARRREVGTSLIAPFAQATKAGFAHIRCGDTAIECMAVSPGNEDRLVASSGGAITLWAYQGEMFDSLGWVLLCFMLILWFRRASRRLD
jgi:hypothetical protein